MLLAARQYPALFDGGKADFLAEGHFGLDWLRKMWDNTHRILYYQVGIGDRHGRRHAYLPSARRRSL
jgi:hypothetical protein